MSASALTVVREASSGMKKKPGRTPRTAEAIGAEVKRYEGIMSIIKAHADLGTVPMLEKCKQAGFPTSAITVNYIRTALGQEMAGFVGDLAKGVSPDAPFGAFLKKHHLPLRLRAKPGPKPGSTQKRKPEPFSEEAFFEVRAALEVLKEACRKTGVRTLSVRWDVKNPRKMLVDIEKPVISHEQLKV